MTSGISMRKSLGLLLVLTFLVVSCIVAVKPAFSSADIAEDSWTSKAPMHQARGGLGVAVVNGKIYAIGGSVAASPTSTGYTYSMYVGTNEVYDPATDTWETKTAMPTARWLLQANVVNEKIYLISGVNTASDLLNVNEVYDPATDSWSTKEPMPTGANLYASAAVDNRIYVIGGFSNGNQIYDPETDSWSLGVAPPSNSLYASAGVTTGVMAPKRIYVLGVTTLIGFAAPPCLTQVYDPRNNSWTVGAAIPTNRINMGVAVVNDTLYAIGGHFHGSFGQIAPSAANEQYTPFGYGTVPPVVAVVSPENKTYNSSSVPLTFAVNKPTQWVGYSLDGRDNVTVTGNTTVTGLQNGLHNLTVYANDTLGNMGASETISFSVEVPFPTTLVVTASGASVAVIGAVLAIYFKKRKH